jgi:hypothetical protein
MARLARGDLCGPYAVLGLVTDGLLLADRVYAVEAQCCGARGERGEKALMDNARLGRDLCLRCSNQRRGGQQVSIQPGDQFGLMTIVKVLARGTYGRFVVRYGCCGRLEEVGGGYLYFMRSEARRTDHVRQCRACYRTAARVKAAALDAPALLTPGLISAAVAWARPESLRGSA